MTARVITWSGILRRNIRHRYQSPLLISVGVLSGRDGSMVRVDYDDPAVIGLTRFSDRGILRGQLSRRFAGVRCNWYGRPCEVPGVDSLWPDQESAETYTSDGGGPWATWPRRDVTASPKADEWHPCRFCGAMIVGGWQFKRHDGSTEFACHDHIIPA